MSVMASRPLIRWALPASVLVVVLGGTAIANNMRASAQTDLPPRSPAQLLVDLRTAQLDGVSGTVIEQADLGLPALPAGIGGDGSPQLNALITGSHTLRVWYSGPDKARVALLGALGESDVIRNGTDVWIWSSTDNTATHQTVRAPGQLHGPMPGTRPTALPSTPQQAADQVLAALDPSTTVTSKTCDTAVAGRSCYELSLAPKDSGSLVSQVAIDIDGSRHVPLQVSVYAKGVRAPVFQIGFQQVNFTRPDPGVFVFTPPPGATVKQGSGPDGDQHAHDGLPDQGGKTPGGKARYATVGTGWTTVLVARLPQGQGPGAPAGRNGVGDPGALGGFLNALPQVHGSFGSGRVLESRLFTALLTDDGRILVGTVDRQRLMAAAADPAAALR